MRANVALRTSCREARSRAASTIAPERSTPSTHPAGPTERAAANETSPVPQATSSTRSPPRSAAAASSAVCASASWLCQSAS
jgi:hypothetical protein